MITRKRYLLIILSVALMLIVGTAAWTETIRLKNGRVFDGIIAEKNDDEYKIVMKSGVITLTRDEIDSIDGRKLNPPPVKKPVVQETEKPVTVTAETTPKQEQEPVVQETEKPVVVTAEPAPKKKPKAVVKVKEQVPQEKPLEGSHFTQFSESTATVTPVASDLIPAPAALPVAPKKGFSPSVKAAISIIGIIIIACLILIIKKIKKPPVDINKGPDTEIDTGINTDTGTDTSADKDTNKDTDKDDDYE